MQKDKIEEYCKSLGLDTIGFIKCRRFEEIKSFYEVRKEMNLQNEFEEDDIEKRINPNWYMEKGKTIISIAFPYLYEDSDSENGFSKYTKGHDYHKVVKSYLDKICEYINSLGGEAIGFVDSNTLPERYIAYLAGIGFIGRNNMIITKKYGSYVFLGEIITDLNIECNDKRVFKDVAKYSECKECIKCIEKCPTKSINTIKINPNICTSYITQKKDISDVEIKLLKGKIFGCDICQDNCPYNSEIIYSEIELFKPLDFMNSSDNNCYAEINNKFFKENISRTSCGWRGKNVIKRNAVIKLHNDEKNINNFKGNSPYIDEYVNRLLNVDKI